MPTDAEIKARFWKALKSDRTLMLGLDGVEDGHARPMTAQFENDRSPIWFFASTDNELVKSLPRRERAIATFASKGHDLFATLHGRLSLDNDRATNRQVLESLRCRLVRGRQERPEARAVALGRGACRDLARRIEPDCRHQALARRRSQGRIQGQGRRSRPSLTLATAALKRGTCRVDAGLPVFNILHGLRDVLQLARAGGGVFQIAVAD